jgi:hypothetical protein
MSVKVVNWDVPLAPVNFPMLAREVNLAVLLVLVYFPMLVREVSLAVLQDLLQALVASQRTRRKVKCLERPDLRPALVVCRSTKWKTK